MRLIGLSHQEVLGIRRTALLSNRNFELIEKFDYSKIQFQKILREKKPDVVVNFASISSVMRSFSDPKLTETVNFYYLKNLLDAAYSLDMDKMRIFQASSSEMFGNSEETKQSENTSLKPVSPYGISKTRAHEKCIQMRSAGMNISTGILFNHESEYRQEGFVTKKIAKFVSEFYRGKAKFIELGNIEISRDWGSAREFILAIAQIVDFEDAQDFVIATGKNTSILDLLNFALQSLNLDVDPLSLIKINETLIRPTEKFKSTGDYRKIRNTLGWRPKVRIEKVIAQMVDFELKSA